jgi:CheY-like chemotaxis protein
MLGSGSASEGPEHFRRPAYPAPTAHFNNARVLLVEDNPVNREVATHMLNAMQCRVDQVANGQEAVELVRKVNFDLVLMDCEMPVMDGFAATAAIRQWERDLIETNRLPIVALTAHALAEDRKRCLEAGMDDFLSKPFSMDDLRSVLARSLPIVDEPPAGQFSVNDALPKTGGDDPYAVIQTKTLDMIGALDPSHGKDLAAKVIEVYEENSLELIKSLSDALNHGDEDRVRTAAHALKSSSGNVGATRLMAMCRAIERAAKEKELMGLSEQIAGVKREHSQVMDELRKWSQG